ncbi:hypothetical protein HMI54_015465 [Coelomomyces lativittatus]|nr:hypothetical protein HMI54_015465 [Coelomomyces lativittatus]
MGTLGLHFAKAMVRNIFSASVVRESKDENFLANTKQALAFSTLALFNPSMDNGLPLTHWTR